MSEFKNKREEVLLTANKIVNGDRQEQYGDPTKSFKRIANLWSAILPVEISTGDVSRMLILLKVSRSMSSDDIDSWVDIAGYASLGAECVENSPVKPKKVTFNEANEVLKKVYPEYRLWTVDTGCKSCNSLQRTYSSNSPGTVLCANCGKTP